jgi:RimJ/RimL family protein N-acetyltransferase
MPTPTDVDIWPLLGFRISVSDVELSAVDDRTALDLGRLAAAGIHGNALQWQGRGIGTLLRIAVLTFAFEGLGARQVTTRAWSDNVASSAVSRKLGYVADGESVEDREGVPTVLRHYRLDRSTWESRPPELRPHVLMEGLEPVRSWLGVA